MSKTMLIDAAHAEETRVVVMSGQELEEFDIETKERQQIRGNIYLAKVTRVEPSLQACFVDFGSPRHGFLAFSEVHPDYYQIPVADREALLEEEANVAADDIDEDDEDGQRTRRSTSRKYKIQDVLRRRQIMLVQAVKEERGNKGAALTTYLSLAGRYCVLMPNTPRGGGISRKISAASDRKRLKGIVSSLDVPKGMGLIIRTAGAKRNKTEIKRDYEYLLRLWDDIRNRTLESVAPTLIHEEESLVKRAIRDLYNKDIGSIIIEGDKAYKEAKDFMKMLIPSHARKIHQYKHSMPLFSRLGVEKMLSAMHSSVVQLKSGGYLVINQTEALVAVDVNSGKSTRERSIEQTALKTNLEAAEEVARQMRIRDLAGLIVIDFIDMDEPRNNRSVEKRVKDALRLDRARVQMSKISNFGLMEVSRQRRRTGILEGSSHTCPTCSGFGRIRSVSSTATQIIRELEAKAGGKKCCEITIKTDMDTAFYLLNDKRKHIAMLEMNRGMVVRIETDSKMHASEYEIEFLNNGEESGEADFNFGFMKEDEIAQEANAEEIITEGEEILEQEAEENISEIKQENNRNKRSKQKNRRKGPRNIENNEASISSEVQEVKAADVEVVQDTANNSPAEVTGQEDKTEDASDRNNYDRQKSRNFRDRRRGLRTGLRTGRRVRRNDNQDGAENNSSEAQAPNNNIETKSEIKSNNTQKFDNPTNERVENTNNNSQIINNEGNNDEPVKKKTGWWARNASKLYGSE